MHNLCKQNLSNAKVQLYYNVVVCINLVSRRDPGQLNLIFIQCGSFHFLDQSFAETFAES